MKRMLTTEEILQITTNKTDIEALKSGKVNCYEATNLTALSKDFINNLKAGDVVLKKTGTSPNYYYHAYRVSFKKNNEGICLTYTDAGYMETVSYDKSGTNWVYNSTDVVNVNRMEQIVDADGHNRFIEGVGSPTTIAGVTYDYHRWSLSGSHLMLVCSGSVINGTTIPGGTMIEFVLPEWIRNKIYPIYESGFIEPKTLSMYDSLLVTSQNLITSLIKSSSGVRVVTDSVTLTADRAFRIQFDLVIDNTSA